MLCTQLNSELKKPDVGLLVSTGLGMFRSPCKNKKIVAGCFQQSLIIALTIIVSAVGVLL